ncbi:MAG: Tim44/TimA family putative adaptor protein [Caulobacterales bacterium]
MENQWVEIVILAAAAAFVLARLYSVLGRRTGSERPSTPPAAPRPAPAQGSVRDPLAKPSPRLEPEFSGAAGSGLGQIQMADPSFDPAQFAGNARAAYEAIVHAFGVGDRDALRPLLTPRVFDAYAKAITEREGTGEQGPELVRLKTAEIVDANLSDQIARVVVKFEAELAHGLHGLRDTLEKWTFERDVRSRDPTWFLAKVASA